MGRLEDSGMLLKSYDVLEYCIRSRDIRLRSRSSRGSPSKDPNDIVYNMGWRLRFYELDPAYYVGEVPYVLYSICLAIWSRCFFLSWSKHLYHWSRFDLLCLILFLEQVFIGEFVVCIVYHILFLHRVRLRTISFDPTGPSPRLACDIRYPRA